MPEDIPGLQREAELWRTLMASTFEGIVISENAVVVEANEQFARMHGYEPGQVVGMPVTAFVVPEERERVLRAARGGREGIAEYQALRRDGSQFTVEAHGRFASQGERKVRVTEVRDVSQRKLAETALRASEDRFRCMLENSIEVAYRRDLQANRYDYLSPAVENVLGYRVAELQNLPLNEVLALLHPEDLPLVKHEIGRTLEGTGAVGRVEYRFRDKKGRYRWVADSFRMLLDDKGKPLYCVGSVRDISRLKQAERRTDLLAETASQLLKTDSPQAVIDTLCRKVMAFLDCEVFFNLLADETTGRLHLNAFAGISEAEARQTQWGEIHLANCGCAVRDECQFTFPDSTSRQHPCANLARSCGIQALVCYALKIQDRLLGTLSFGARNRPRFTAEELETMKAVADLVAIAIERQRIQNELRRANADLEQRVLDRTRSLQETTDQLNTFCYSIAHDLRAPIRAQVGYAQLLLSQFGEALGPEGCNYAERIAEAAERQGELVDDLLAHMSLDRTELPLELVDLAASIRNVRADLSLQIKKQSASLEVGPLHGPVLANPASLHLILTNLLSNALKFVTRGTRPEVRVWAERHSGFIRLWVEDNGIGIPPEGIGKLFGVFQRLHTRGEYPGTGIGLAIVRKAAERMGGRVGALSTPGKGSRFWVELPQAPAGAVDEHKPAP